MRVAEHLTERMFKVNSELVAKTVMVKDLTDGEYYIMIEVFDEGDYRKCVNPLLANNLDAANEVYEGVIEMFVEELGFIQVSGKLGGIYYEG